MLRNFCFKIYPEGDYYHFINQKKQVNFKKNFKQWIYYHKYKKMPANTSSG